MAEKTEKKWIFNWKFGLIVLGIMILFNREFTPASLLGYFLGAVIVSVLTGFDKSLRFK